MRKLRLYFALFFVLLTIPIVVLLSPTYSNLEEESFFFYRRSAEGVVSAVHQQLAVSLAGEEQRPYTHYRYIHVADQPVPQQEGLNLSPLASFPVQSETPGILGYWQIDSNGSFNTPLLPDEATGEGVSVSDREARERLKDQLASLLEGQPFSSSAGFRSSTQGLEQEENRVSPESTLSKLKSNLESKVDVRLEEAYKGEAEPGTSAYLPRLRSKDQESPESAKRRVQKASSTQAQVFDSQIGESDSDQPTQAKESTAPQQLDLLDRAAGRKDDTAQDLGDKETQDGDEAVGPEVVVEVDPFRSELVDGEWLVFYRKVWSGDRRYIQGFTADLTEFLKAHLDAAFLNSALPDTASYLVLHRGEILESEDGYSDSRPLLLYSSAMPYPLSDFHLAITVAHLPVSPGYRVVNFLAIFLSLLFVGGLLGIYRLTATQMELSQQKSDFVSAVSHELKTPLTSIRMYGEMLTEGWVKRKRSATTSISMTRVSGSPA